MTQRYINMFRLGRQQDGFTLIQALFLIVVLGILGLVMMRFSTSQTVTTTMAVQGARTYQAACSGLEWGAARATAGQSCDGEFVLPDGFRVTVVCSGETVTEGEGAAYAVYRIAAHASYGAIGSVDYVARSAEMKVALP